MILIRKGKLLVLLGIIALLSISLTAVFHSYYRIEGVSEIDMSVTVGQRLGIDTRTESLTFGIVTKGGSSSSRFVEISNENDQDLRVGISSSGEMGEWLSISENFFILKPDESRKISFSVTAPPDAEFGDYTGKVRFVYERI